MADKQGHADMWIEPAPAKPAPPKTFTDKNLERGYGEGGANNVTTRGAKPGGSMSYIQRSIKIPRTKVIKS